MKPFFSFLTLFPETIKPWLTTSILGKAHANHAFDFELIDLRTFSKNKHKSVDDMAYGGGGGMVLSIEPLVEAIEHIQAKTSEKPWVVYFSPRGEKITSTWLDAFAEKPPAKHFVLVCGHYEGVDQRFIEGWVDQEVSLGDFVITGGELPAVAFVDGYLRKLDATFKARRPTEESFSLKDPQTGKKLLEYPQYTRPPEFRGKKVPEILLSGDHGKIEKWRLEKAREITLENRPDL